VESLQIVQCRPGAGQNVAAVILKNVLFELKALPVAGMNCHMPAALALDTAWGLKALSTKGKSASSVGMPRNSNSSTM